MTTEITTYDFDSGRFLSPKVVSVITPEVSNNNIYVLGLHDPRTEYMKAGVVTPRPPNPTLQLGTTLYNVPLPSTIKIGEDRYAATDSTVELVFPLPGVYHVTVISFPWLDEDFVVVKP